MNRTLKVIFCIFFFAVCLFFSLATFIPGASKITEGGIERPSLVKDGFINDDFGTDYEEYFSRAFAYRGFVVDLWSQTRAAIIPIWRRVHSAPTASICWKTKALKTAGKIG